MPLSPLTVLEVRAGGSDTNGGGFTTGGSGTDWSQQTAPQYSVTDGVLNGTTTITSATAAWGTDVVDNLISVNGGTGSATQVWKRILSRTNATTIVVDSSAGLTAGTGVALKIGGALASVGQAVAIPNTQGAWVACKYQASPYVFTSAGTNIPGGCMAPPTAITIFSYDINRTPTNTDANRSTLQFGAGVSTATFLSTASEVRNFILDANGQTTSKGVTGGTAVNCHAINCTSSGFTGTARNCSATANSGPAFSSCAAYSCEAWGNSNAGFFTCTGSKNLSYGNTGASGFGYQNCASMYDSDAYGNAQDGFIFGTGSGIAEYINCISEGNTGAGWKVNATTAKLYLRNCGDFGNSSRSVASTIAISDTGPITGSGSFFTNAASSDFSLNNTSGRGAALRGVGFPQTFPRGLTASRPDIGASQHTDPTTDYPVIGDVRSGVTYASGANVGTLALPAIGDVQSGVQFGTSGTQYTGTFAFPIVGNVRLAIGYGAGGTEFTGTLALPAVGDVRLATQYGAAGTEFTGTLTTGGGPSADAIATAVAIAILVTPANKIASGTNGVVVSNVTKVNGLDATTATVPTASEIAVAWGASVVGNGRTRDYFLQGGMNKIAFDLPSVGQFTTYLTDDTTPLNTGTYLRGSPSLGPLTAIDPV